MHSLSARRYGCQALTGRNKKSRSGLVSSGAEAGGLASRVSACAVLMTCRSEHSAPSRHRNLRRRSDL